MSAPPWIRFYPSDWLAGTRGMTAAETGIYITLIAMMYERQEPIAEDHPRLARLCGASASVFKRVLDALVDEKKIVRKDGGLWNDRVGKEAGHRLEITSAASANAKTRWARKGNKDKPDAVPAHESGINSADANQNQISEEDANASSKRARDAEFAAWYRHYPHKVGRGQAEKAFPAARKLASLDELIDGVRRYVQDKPPDRHWKNPATWLNGKGWLDEPAQLPLARQQGPPRGKPNAFDAYAEIARERGWIDEPGFLPGTHNDDQQLPAERRQPQGAVVDLRPGAFRRA